MNVLNVVPMSVPKSPRPLPAAPHQPVLLAEVMAALEPRGKVLVDATVGAGGHAEAMLERGAAHVIAIDRDATALERSRERLSRFAGKVTFVHAPFGRIAEVVRGALAKLGRNRVDGILADLGVSSMQLDEAERGMSFRRSGPLDMRMDREHGETALELIARLEDDELTEILSKLGEERRARRVARCIKQALDGGELYTTHDLRRAVVRAVGPARVGGVDPATRTFQALRMAVNQELAELDALLSQAAELLDAGGVLAVISFHSLEDRMVKRATRDGARWQALTKKPIVPGEEEIDANPRSRSAKLRVARRREVM